MKKTTKLLIYIALAFSIACQTTQNSQKVSNNVNNDYLINAVLFHQKAAEYKALCIQAYNLAEMVLNEELRNSKYIGKRAIIVDIDETVLDNSPFQANCIISNQSYPLNWDEWVNLAQAKAIPGAVKFLNYSYGKGINIFYISNRRENLKEATIKNLKAEGFPDVSDDHVIMYDGNSSKEKRRASIAENYKITLLIGDNLGDFDKAFDHLDIENRDKAVDFYASQFGVRFIVIPNPMYGDWEGAIFDYNYNLSEKEKDQKRRKALVNYK